MSWGPGAFGFVEVKNEELDLESQKKIGRWKILLQQKGPGDLIVRNALIVVSR